MSPAAGSLLIRVFPFVQVQHLRGMKEAGLEGADALLAQGVFSIFGYGTSVNIGNSPL